MHEALKTLLHIVEQMDDILDALKENVSLLSEMVQNGEEVNPNTLLKLREIEASLSELPWILSETGLEMVRIPPPPPVDKDKLN